MEVSDGGIPYPSRLVRYQGNDTSRTHPAGDHRNLPHSPANSRNARVRKSCSQR
jgi:hypothetical protein